MAGVHDAVRDALTVYTKPLTGAYYFVPSIQGIKQYTEQ
jgi:putative iron-dependent peroxidase